MNPDDYATGRFADIPHHDLDQVHTANDAARIVAAMRVDLAAHPTDWENHTLDRFLEALAAYIDDTHDTADGQLTWTQFCHLLIAATGYE